MPTLIEETPARSTAISEKLVAEVWKRQLLSLPLHTTAGQKLDVVYCGRSCCDHGPDFRGALIAFDGELRRGDVEVHLRAADWGGHGHHRDQAYVGVILHVIMWPPGDLLPRKSNGETAPVLCLEQHLGASAEEMASMVTARPYVPFRCTLKLGNAYVLRLLDEAGEQRLREKAASMEGAMAVTEPEEVLYRAIMAALGYSRNTAVFAQLAEIAPFSLLKTIAMGEKPALRPLLFRAFLLGKANLLASDGEAKDEWRKLSAWDDGCRLALPWRLGRVRPSNFPSRRLAGAAELLAAVADLGLADTFVEAIRNGERDVVYRRLERMLMVKAVDGGYLIGRARAAEIMANAVIPFALALGESTGDNHLVRQALAAFACQSAFPENEISRYMAEMVLDGPDFSIGRTARRQQGLLHLYKRWCKDKRCADCPLGQFPGY